MLEDYILNGYRKKPAIDQYPSIGGSSLLTEKSLFFDPNLEFYSSYIGKKGKAGYDRLL